MYKTSLTIARRRGCVSRGQGYKPRNPYDKSGSYKKRLTDIDVNKGIYYYWVGEMDLINK